ncbi:MAG: AraC family transcriptional regulator [Gammaproteobacteria bacterium]|nr:AraC family transcriptional regulator [Gammaproteobacteria bacterium]
MNQLSISQNYFGLFAEYLNKVTALNSCSNKPLLSKVAAPIQKYGLEVQSLANMESLVERIISHTGDSSFGLDIGTDIHPSDYGIVGYALMNCPDLVQALDLAAHYKQMMNQAFDTHLVRAEHRSYYRVKLVSECKCLAPMIEFDFASAIQLARFLVGRQLYHQVKFLQINFQHAPLASLDKYQRIFNCPVQFNQANNEIVISNSVLELPIRSANPAILKMFLKKVKRLEQSSQSFSQRVFNYVTKHSADIPGVTQAASHFSMSSSTLKKHLMQEGDNYSAICDSVRKTIAIKLTSDPTIQIKAIHCSLNFSSASAFNRAFKRWTTMTPTAYRREVIHDRAMNN